MKQQEIVSSGCIKYGRFQWNSTNLLLASDGIVMWYSNENGIVSYLHNANAIDEM